MTDQQSASERWQRIKEIVADAAELTGESRAALIAQRCEGDTALAAEVHSLLSYSGDTHSLLDQRPPLIESSSVRAEAAERTRVGDSFGPWRVLAELGRGGMGLVYLAERADGAYQQRVAIKLLRGGPNDPRSIARMSRERQALAALDHPNIARLIDGGNAINGTPYFAMEFVDGVSIERYCSTNALPLAARIHLVLLVCEAVQSAHQKLVIHRDLKPSNVLVSQSGVPKLLDFGVARLMEGGEDNAELTQGALLFTPRYASPEQVRGLPVSVATDVYGLGLLLYELLAGESPYERLSSNSATSAAAAMQAVANDKLRRASTVAQRHQPGFAKSLECDLDTILQKACAREPSERYSTVAALRDDLVRFLEHRPISARAPTLSYVGQQLVRRHPVAIAASVIAVLGIAAGMLGTLMQKQRAEAAQARAEARYQQVSELASRVVSDYSKAIAALPGGTELRLRMSRDAIKQLDELARDAPNDSAVAVRLAAAYQQLASVSYSDHHASAGDGKAHDDAIRKADALVAQAIAKSVPSSRTSVAAPVAAPNVPAPSTPVVATARIDAKPSDARTIVSPATAVETTKASTESSALDLALKWSELQRAQAVRLRGQGEYDKAQPFWEAVITRFSELQLASPNDARVYHELIESNFSLAQLAIVNQRRAGKAYLDAGKLALEKWKPQNPPKNELDYFAIRLHRTEAIQCTFEKDTACAIRSYEAELLVHESRLKREPNNAEWIGDAAKAHKGLGGHYMVAGKWANALVSQERALTLMTPLYRADPADQNAYLEVVWMTRDHGIALANSERKEEGAAEFERAHTMCTPVVDTDRATMTMIRICTNVAWWTTKSRLRFEHPIEAKESANRIVQIKARYPQLFENKLEQLWLRNAQEAIAGEPLSASTVGPPVNLPQGPTSPKAADAKADPPK